MYANGGDTGNGFRPDYSLQKGTQFGDSSESDDNDDDEDYDDSRGRLSKCGLVCGKNTYYTRGLTCTQQYVITSLVLLCVGVGLIGWDYYCTCITQNASYTSQQFAMGILVMHSVAFYQALLAFVYHTQKTHGRSKCLTFWTITSVVLNTVAFILRLGFEIAYIGYRPERLRGK